MRMIWNAIIHLKDFVRNLLYFVDHSPMQENFSLVRNMILSLPDSERMKYRVELEFIANLPLDKLQYLLIPYPPKRCSGSIQSGDVKRMQGLPYVEYEGGNKLFFPSRMTIEDVVNAYNALVMSENIIGDNGSPHCYQAPGHQVENGDIILDIGCAEALFALDNIAKASKVYLFESSREWRKPLSLTFSKYAAKTIFVNKIVADKTGRNSTTIADAVKETSGEQFFVKMDIEGWERLVIKGNMDFFKNHRVKVSCCVYHRQDDAEVIETMFKEMGYKTRFSDGYMVSIMNGVHYPYFRHGVLYAQNF